jgi:putative hemolysin
MTTPSINHALPLPHESLRDPRAEQLESLIRVNTDDLLRGLGLADLRRGRRVIERVLRGRARHFARRVIAYDELVGSQGLAAGGAWAVTHFVDRCEVHGAEYLPRCGPVLIVANHPGLCDTAALFAAIDRADLRVVAAERPFLAALPYTSRHLISVGESPASRLAALRSSARHLRGGGALLTFPAGRIEPDPAVMPGAHESLAAWSDSVATFARFAPDLVIIPAIVSGVLSRSALQHPLTRLRRRAADREWLVGLLQIQFRSLQHVTVRVAFGDPLRAADHDDSASISHAVRAAAARLIDAVPRG